MKDIRQFPSGSLYGLKVRTREVRSGARIIVASRWNDQLHGFECRAISAEGVAGQYQALKFETEDQARQWANSQLVGHLTGYNPEDFELVATRAGTFMRIPLAGVDFDGWVSPTKFTHASVSERNMNHLMGVAPEYFDENAPGPATDETHTNSNRNSQRIFPW